MFDTDSTTLSWIRTGGIGGLAAIASYLTLIMVPLPLGVNVALTSLFGIGFGLGCIGLRAFLALDRPRVGLDAAAGMGVLAALTVVQMIVVQLAIRFPPIAAGELGVTLTAALDRVHFGLDVVWDMLGGAATLLFAVAAWRHPRLGAPYAIAGVLVAGALLILNLMTFPVPPAFAGSIDVGPFVALWYVAVTSRMLGSLKWVRARLAGAPARAGVAPAAPGVATLV